MKKLFFNIREAILGTDQDFTSGSLSRAIFLLSIPMVLEMVMESIFAVVDIYFVSKLGVEAIATVGITESLITIIYAIAVGLSTATTAMVARRIGEKDPEGASVAAFQAILLGFLISLIIAIPGIFLASKLLHWMGASGETFRSLSIYTAIMLGGNVSIMLLFIINAVFRSSGNAAVSMRVLWIANIINLILDPCLIFGLGPFPELGIMGAAIATTTGRGLTVIYQFYLLFYGKKRVQLSRSVMRIDFGVMKGLIKLSLGGIGQSIIATSSWIGLVRIISIFGSEVLAGYTIAIRLIIFALLPSWGVSNAAATLVGQNLGAKKPERAEKAAWTTGKINLIMLSSIGIILIMFPNFFIGLFTNEAGVILSGASALRIISYGFLAYGFGMVMINAFNGAGDTMLPTRLNLLCFWIIEIPLAYVLAISFD
ncbi:MAG: MATE family efflux transporter, partial [Bacteroidales bacterium]|nr:MATE family efflux transporter [Bacteroidales bacterium]